MKLHDGECIGNLCLGHCFTFVQGESDYYYNLKQGLLVDQDNLRVDFLGSMNENFFLTVFAI